MPSKKKASKKKKPITLTHKYTFEEAIQYLKEFFDENRTVVNDNYRDVRKYRAQQEERQKLWNVMTALRGPDNHDDDLKTATTCIVRYAVFGNETSVQRHGYVNYDNTSHLTRRKSFIVNPHFRGHITAAFRALDLKWDEVNP